MAKDKCYIDYKGASSLRIPYDIKKLEKIEQTVKNMLQAEGKDFTDIDIVSEKISELINNEQRTATQQMLSKTDTYLKLKRIRESITEMEKNGLSVGERLDRMNAMIIDSYDVFGGVPLAAGIKANEVNLLGEFLEKVRKQLNANGGDEIDPLDFLKKAEDMGDFFTEMNALMKDPNNANSVTKNTNAFKVAKEYVNSRFAINEQRKLSGKNVAFNETRLRPKWSINKIQKADREQFVNRIANALDVDVHGDLARRTTLAENLYDNMTNNGHWREQGDIQPKNLKNNWIPLDDREPSFSFSDGRALVDIIQDYSDHSPNHTLLLDFKEVARNTALVQKFGGDYKNGAEEYKRILTDLLSRSTDNAVSLRSQETKGIINFIDEQVNPQLIEAFNFGSTFRKIRHWQAATKLGSAVVTAILDIPNFVFSGRHLFGLPTSKVLASIFQYGYKGAPKDYAKYAEKMLMGMDTYLDNIMDRFGHLGQGVAGASENRWAMVSNAVFKLSGLNWWTEGRRAMAVSLYGSELGELITKKSNWNDINKTFRAQLEKYGLTEKEWKQLLRDQPVDGKGRIDIYAIKENDYELSYGKSSTRQKLIASMRDAMDTMVTTASDYDVIAGRLFNRPDSWGGEVIRTLFQFKTHPITFTRKTFTRAWKSADSKTQAFARLTELTAEMFLIGMAVVMLKDLAKGKNPRDPLEDGNIWIQAAEQSGMWGLWSDTLIQFGGSYFLSQFTDEAETGFLSQNDQAKQLLGPFISDLMRFTPALGDLAKRYKDDNWDGMLQPTTDGLLRTVPGQNIWWLSMFRRLIVNDYILQRTDPAGYRKQQKKLRKKAQDNRFNNSNNNIVYDKLKEIIE